MSDNKAVSFQDHGASISVGSVFADFTQVKNIFLKKSYVVVDVVYIVRSMMIASILRETFFLSLFPKQYR